MYRSIINLYIYINFPQDFSSKCDTTLLSQYCSVLQEGPPRTTPTKNFGFFVRNFDMISK